MDVNRILLDILIVLLAAKLAAEVADRLKIPAVVGEIAAGMIVGPSVLGLVHESEALQTLAQLGVILLLLEVGLEMDLGELGSVGRAALSVAVVGIVVPFVTGAGAGMLLGMETKEAIFVGAALTATSVGITARVFGDLRALATVEARTVLGAAVADDVLGLIILTVVTRVVTEGSISVLGLLWVVVLAVGFVVLTTLVGVKVVPSVFQFIRRYSRSAGTLVALALAFTLGVSELAHAVELAPIVGAFVAGLALARSSVAHQVRTELAPVGHLLIPVFFLQIGIEAEIDQFFEPKVLGLAAALLVVAVVGKLASAIGLFGAPGDRWLVGIGMIPRGEVGLIFATLGLQQGVFGQDVYAALILVVLVTTVGTPPLLRARLMALRARRRAAASAETVASGGEVLRVDANGSIELVGEPLPSDALVGALTAARLAQEHTLGTSVLEWLDEFPPGPKRWDERARAEFWRLLHEGGPKSWRLLTATGVLQRALPELDDALAQHRADAFDLDPLAALSFRRLEAVRSALAHRDLDATSADPTLLAALVLDACDGSDTEPVIVARRTVSRLDLGARIENTVAALIGDAGLLAAAIHRPDALDREVVLQLAVHLESAERADALALFTRATQSFDRLDIEKLDALMEVLGEVFARPELVDRGATFEVDRRREEASAKSLRAPIRERIHAAPREYVLAQSTDDLVRHAQLCEPQIGRGEVRVRVDPLGDGGFRVEFATQDRIGLIARSTRVLFEAGLSITEALAVTWGDGTALTSYRVAAAYEPEEAMLVKNMHAFLDTPLEAPAAPGVTLSFDDHGSPWYTRCTAEAVDRPGLLYALATAFAVAGVNVHSARVTTNGSIAVDLFDLSGRTGGKLDERAKERIRGAVASGTTPQRRRLRIWRRRPAPAPQSFALD